MNKYKFISGILLVFLVILGAFTFLLMTSPARVMYWWEKHIQHKNVTVTLSNPSASPMVPIATSSIVAIVPTTTVSSTLPDEYLNSKYRVLGTFQNFGASTTVADINQLINQVALVVVTDRTTDGQNDSQCGSIYTQPVCYFFMEPLYVYGAPSHAVYLGSLEHKGAFIPSSIKFIAPDMVEFHTADGDAGCFSDTTWQLNLSQ